MKVTKTLIRYTWLYHFGNESYGATNCFFGENSFIGSFGVFLVFIGSILLMLGLGGDNKIMCALGSIILALGALFCLINAIKRMIVGRNESKKVIEKATFEIKTKNK